MQSIFTLVILFFGVSSSLFGALTYEGTGSWSDSNNWLMDDGSNCNCIPQSTDQVIIPNGAEVFISSNIFMEMLTIEQGGKLIINRNLNLSNDVIINRGTLSFFGNMRQVILNSGSIDFADGQINLRIEGNNGTGQVGGNDGLIIIPSAANLGGTIAVEIDGTFTPSNNESITLIEFGAGYSCGFDAVTYSEMNWNTNYYPNAVLAEFNTTVGEVPSCAHLNILGTELTESSGQACFQLFLDEVASTNFSVDYATQNGTAIDGQDYIGQSGTVSFTTGEISQLVCIDLIADSDIENQEDFSINLTNPSGLILETSIATATIFDDDNKCFYGNEIADAKPWNFSLNPSHLVVYNGAMYFQGRNTSNNYELMRYDGSQIDIVQEINPSTVSGSAPRYLTVFDEKLLFTANSNLWQYNGNTATEIPTPTLSFLTDSKLTIFDNKLFFKADDNVAGIELFFYDGNTVQLVTDIHSTGDSSPENLTVFQDKLYFTADDGVNDRQIWFYDGSNATRLTSGGLFDEPSELKVYNGKLYFSATDDIHGKELWSYDGQNFVLVQDIRTGTTSSEPANLAVHNGKLYFSLWDGSAEIWKYDGQTASLALDASASFTFTYDLQTVNGHLFFRIGSALRFYNEDEISFLINGTGINSNLSIVQYNGEIIYNGIDNLVSINLQESPNINLKGPFVDIEHNDNTPNWKDNTDFGKLGVGNTREHLFAIENQSCLDLQLTGTPLVQITGENASDFGITEFPTAVIPATTTRFFRIDFTPSAIGLRHATIEILSNDAETPVFTFDIQGKGVDYNISIQDAVAYEQDGAAHQVCLEVFLNYPHPDGVTADYILSAGSATAGLDYADVNGTLTINPDSINTLLCLDILPDYLSESVETFQVELQNVNGATINNGTATVSIYDDDSSSCESVTMVQDFNPNGNGAITNAVILNDVLFFSIYDGTQRRLAFYDGNNIAFDSHLDGVNLSQLLAFENELIYTAPDTELWSYDGSTSTKIDEITGTFSGAEFSNFIIFQNKLYYTAALFQNILETRIYDGSTVSIQPDDIVGTRSVLHQNRLFLNVNQSYDGSEFFKENNYTFNYANFSYNGQLLAQTGTYTVAYDGVNNDNLVTTTIINHSSDLQESIIYNGKMYFQGPHDASVGDLWEYDGNSFKVVPNSLAGTGVNYLTVCNGKLYFSAYNSTYGSELWVYDGTTIRLVADLNPGSSNGYPSNLICFQDDLYFTANDGTTGNEWHKLNPETNGAIGLQYQGILISNGDHTPDLADGTDFENVTENTAVSRDFTIKNSDCGPVELTGQPLVTLTGDIAQFNILQQPAANRLGGEDSLKFTVQYFPNELAEHTATVQILSNDVQNPSFTFDLKGKGVPQLPSCSSINNIINGATHQPNNLTLNWNEATGIVDGYVLRAGINENGQELLDLNVGITTTYDITDLPHNTYIFTVITPYNEGGNALDCPETHFITDTHFETGEITKIAASDGATSVQFGQSVAIDEDYAIVGAYHQPTNGTPSGAAYIYHKIEDQWAQQAKIFAADAMAGDWFGYAVDIQGDIAVVGAFNHFVDADKAGAAYVFERVGNAWIATGKLIASDPEHEARFGFEVAVYGNRIAVGADSKDGNNLNEGAVYVFEKNENGNWLQTAKLVASTPSGSDAFGRNLSLYQEDLMIGCRGDDDLGGQSGSVYYFHFDGQAWIENKITAPDGMAGDFFGSDVGTIGNLLIVGATGATINGHPNAGKAYIFEKINGVWTHQKTLTHPTPSTDDFYGIRVGIASEQALVRNAETSSAGALFLYFDDGIDWVHHTTFTDNALLKNSIDMSATHFIAGSVLDAGNVAGSGTAYIYEFPTTALAVNALDLRAELQGNEALLEWQVEEVQNIHFFELEHSKDGIHWQQKTTLMAVPHGLTYSYQDKNLAEGWHYYRLKIHQTDANIKTSAVRSLEYRTEQSLVVIYPNPASTELFIELPGDENTLVEWRILHISGKEIKRGVTTNGNSSSPFTIDVKDMTVGIYVLEIRWAEKERCFYQMFQRL